MSPSSGEGQRPASANAMEKDEEKALSSDPGTGNRQDTCDDEKRYMVDWEPDASHDPLSPYSWSIKYRAWVTAQLALMALAASLASAITAPASPAIARYLGVTEEIVVLNVSLYVFGFVVGPLLWAPISEVWGRRISLLPPLIGLALFSIGTATSQNAQSVFITRFFSGVFGSAPVANVAAGIGDLWSKENRGFAMSIYSVCVVGGPLLGPTIGAALTVNPNLGWRWTEYLTAIIVGATVVLCFFCLPEVYGPVILKGKAQKMRKQTGNEKWFHPHERIEVDVKSIVTKQLSRPVVMFLTEPMCTAICFYASFVFAILYMTLEIFPIVFEDMRGWGTVVGSLPFLGAFVGVLVAQAVNLGNQPRYKKISRAAGGKPVPEARCPPMFFGGVLFAIGLFWFGWTANPSIHWIVPVIATACFGAGFNIIFQQCINFLVDTYGLYAASATAANTFFRSILACGLPLAVRPMVKAIGIGPALSLLGGVGCFCAPLPLLFIKFGPMLRKRSKFAPYQGEK